MAKILFVEDDDTIRILSARALRNAGHLVDLECDGAAGLRQIDSVNGAYDLIVSDIRMPEMDGIELAQNCAVRYPRLRVMLVTGYADQRERADAINGVIDVVQKPFTLAEIRNRVERSLAT